MINCYSKNGWDPLETVLLGGFIEPDTLKVILDYSKFDPIRPWLMKIAQETEEDLDNIQYVRFGPTLEIPKILNVCSTYKRKRYISKSRVSHLSKNHINKNNAFRKSKRRLKNI